MNSKLKMRYNSTKRTFVYQKSFFIRGPREAVRLLGVVHCEDNGILSRIGDIQGCALICLRWCDIINSPKNKNLTENK